MKNSDIITGHISQLASMFFQGDIVIDNAYVSEDEDDCYNQSIAEAYD